MSQTLENLDPAAIDEDCARLTATELADRYRPEYSSWRNMKSRRKSEGAQVHSEFLKFNSFLKHVGRRPAGHTLDRKDPENPLYGPGLVRWADKKTQANNRSNNRYVDVGGERISATEAAERLGIKPDTLRKRLARGWSVEKALSDAATSGQQWPGPQDAERIAYYERQYLTRPLSMEGHTRADFYIQQTRVVMGQRQTFLARTQDMVAFITQGATPPGVDPTDMDWSWQKEFGNAEAAQLQTAVQAHEAFLNLAQTRLDEAESLRAKSRWNAPDGNPVADVSDWDGW